MTQWDQIVFEVAFDFLQRSVNLDTKFLSRNVSQKQMNELVFLSRRLKLEFGFQVASISELSG